jgi:hypothetical protein
MTTTAIPSMDDIQNSGILGPNIYLVARYS